MWTRLVPLAALLTLACLTVPDSAVHPTTITLTKVDSAESVDFSDEVVWILVLGSDARAGQDVNSGNTDAIHLVGLDLPSHRAVDIGIPRDFYIDLPGTGPERGLDRINTALDAGGPDLASQAVDDLMGIKPHYVFVVGFDGLRDMVGTVRGVTVFADQPVPDLDIRRGRNHLDGRETLAYARTRDLTGDDFARSANQQQIMLGILRQVLAHEGETGFIEDGVLAALQGLETDLPPTELYRLGRAVTQIDPDLVTICVLTGDDFETESGDQVLDPDEEAAQRLGRDIRNDAQINGDC